MRRPVKATGKERRSMSAELAALRVGVMTPEDFVRRTFGDWTALGEYLHGRWSLPPGLDAEDARQEMLLALFEQEAVESWDPARQVSLSRYVVWNACAATKQVLHKQRGALRWSGKAQSRFPIAFSMLGVREDESEPENVAEADQESTAAARQIIDAIGDALDSPRDRAVWRVLQECGGDRQEAVQRLLGDLMVRELLDLATEGDVRAAVSDTIAAAREAVRALDAA